MMKSKFLLRMMCAGFLPALGVCIALLNGNLLLRRNSLKVFAADSAKNDILTLDTADGKHWVKANHGVLVNVVMKNTIKKPLSFVVGNSSPYLFSVVNEKHEVVPLTRYGSLRYKPQSNSKPHVYSRHMMIGVAPGEESKSFNMLISQLYDMSVPGRYFITVSMHVRIGDEKQVIKSNKLPVEVTDYNHGEKTPEEAEYEQKWQEKQAKQKRNKANHKR